MFTPTALMTKAPDASHPTLCASLCPNDKLHCQADGTCLCSSSGQLCYNPPASTLPPPLFTDSAGHICPPSAVDANGMCPYFSSGAQPYTDPNGVTCYPAQLDAYGYCPGSLQPDSGNSVSSGSSADSNNQGRNSGGVVATDGGGSSGNSTKSNVDQAVIDSGDQSSMNPDYGAMPFTDSSGMTCRTDQVTQGFCPFEQPITSPPPTIAPSPYAWAQLSTTAKIAIVLLGLSAVGGGYYMIKRRRQRAAQ